MYATPQGATQRSTRFGHKTEERDCGQGPLLWFLWQGMGEAGQTGLGLTSVIFQWALGAGAVPHGLGPGRG